tara:strand:- start:451 stop:690 length:240 start_codon:yes stop_codon:yes gene_type:complete
LCNKPIRIVSQIPILVLIVVLLVETFRAFAQVVTATTAKLDRSYFLKIAYCSVEELILPTFGIKFLILRSKELQHYPEE